MGTRQDSPKLVIYQHRNRRIFAYPPKDYEVCIVSGSCRILKAILHTGMQEDGIGGKSGFASFRKLQALITLRGRFELE